MTRRALVALTLGLSCGGGSAAIDGPVAPPDAPLDAPVAPDGGGPLPADLGSCSADQPCAAGTDCIRIEWLGGDRRCLRRCQHTRDCGLDEICYAAVMDSRYAAMAQHCYISLCESPLASCRLGMEVDLDSGEQLDGSCLPLDDTGATEADGSQGPLGQCLEAGDLAEDQPCDLTNRDRAGRNCAQGLICADMGSDVGACARLCDPLATPDPCPTGRACFDSSVGATVRDPQSGVVLTQLHATRGTCRTGQRCTVTVTGSCPTGQGCLPTNPVRSDGFCSDQGAGERALGERCVPLGAAMPAAADRCAEAYCDASAVDGGSSGVCRAWCDSTHACAAGSCGPYPWDQDPAGLPNLTQGFGVCP